MMNKISLAQRTLNKLFPKISKDSKISLREMMYALGNARDTLITKMAWAAYSSGEDIIYNGSLSEFKVSVLKREDDCLYSFELPAKPLGLPKGMGVYQITPNCNKKEALVPVEPTFYPMYGSSLVEGLSGSIGYYQVGIRVYIVSGEVGEDTELDLLMVCESEGIASDEYFPLQPDMENDVIALAAQQFAVTLQIPEDNRNDSAQAT